MRSRPLLLALLLIFVASSVLGVCPTSNIYQPTLPTHLTAYTKGGLLYITLTVYDKGDFTSVMNPTYLILITNGTISYSETEQYDCSNEQPCVMRVTGDRIGDAVINMTSLGLTTSGAYTVIFPYYDPKDSCQVAEALGVLYEDQNNPDVWINFRGILGTTYPPPIINYSCPPGSSILIGSCPEEMSKVPRAYALTPAGSIERDYVPGPSKMSSYVPPPQTAISEKTAVSYDDAYPIFSCMIIIALMFGAAFATGSNPLYWFSLGAARRAVYRSPGTMQALKNLNLKGYGVGGRKVWIASKAFSAAVALGSSVWSYFDLFNRESAKEKREKLKKKQGKVAKKLKKLKKKAKKGKLSAKEKMQLSKLATINKALSKALAANAKTLAKTSLSGLVNRKPTYALTRLKGIVGGWLSSSFGRVKGLQVAPQNAEDASNPEDERSKPNYPVLLFGGQKWKFVLANFTSVLMKGLSSYLNVLTYTTGMGASLGGFALSQLTDFVKDVLAFGIEPTIEGLSLSEYKAAVAKGELDEIPPTTIEYEDATGKHKLKVECTAKHCNIVKAGHNLIQLSSLKAKVTRTYYDETGLPYSQTTEENVNFNIIQKGDFVYIKAVSESGEVLAIKKISLKEWLSISDKKELISNLFSQSGWKTKGDVSELSLTDNGLDRANKLLARFKGNAQVERVYGPGGREVIIKTIYVRDKNGKLVPKKQYYYRGVDGKLVKLSDKRLGVIAKKYNLNLSKIGSKKLALFIFSSDSKKPLNINRYKIGDKEFFTVGGVVYDADGKVVKNIKENDLKVLEQLASAKKDINTITSGKNFERLCNVAGKLGITLDSSKDLDAMNVKEHTKTSTGEDLKNEIKSVLPNVNLDGVAYKKVVVGGKIFYVVGDKVYNADGKQLNVKKENFDNFIKIVKKYRSVSSKIKKLIDSNEEALKSFDISAPEDLSNLNLHKGVLTGDNAVNFLLNTNAIKVNKSAGSILEGIKAKTVERDAKAFNTNQNIDVASVTSKRSENGQYVVELKDKDGKTIKTRTFLNKKAYTEYIKSLANNNTDKGIVKKLLSVEAGKSVTVSEDTSTGDVFGKVQANRSFVLIPPTKGEVGSGSVPRIKIYDSHNNVIGEKKFKNSREALKYLQEQGIISKDINIDKIKDPSKYIKEHASEWGGKDTKIKDISRKKQNVFMGFNDSPLLLDKDGNIQGEYDPSQGRFDFGGLNVFMGLTSTTDPNKQYLLDITYTEKNGKIETGLLREYDSSEGKIGDVVEDTLIYTNDPTVTREKLLKSKELHDHIKSLIISSEKGYVSSSASTEIGENNSLQFTTNMYGNYHQARNHSIFHPLTKYDKYFNSLSDGLSTISLDKSHSLNENLTSFKMSEDAPYEITTGYKSFSYKPVSGTFIGNTYEKVEELGEVHVKKGEAGEVSVEKTTPSNSFSADIFDTLDDLSELGEFSKVYNVKVNVGGTTSQETSTINLDIVRNDVEEAKKEEKPEDKRSLGLATPPPSSQPEASSGEGQEATRGVSEGVSTYGEATQPQQEGQETTEAQSPQEANKDRTYNKYVVKEIHLTGMEALDSDKTPTSKFTGEKSLLEVKTNPIGGSTDGVKANLQIVERDNFHLMVNDVDVAVPTADAHLIEFGAYLRFTDNIDYYQKGATVNSGKWKAMREMLHTMIKATPEGSSINVENLSPDMQVFINNYMPNALSDGKLDLNELTELKNKINNIQDPNKKSEAEKSYNAILSTLPAIDLDSLPPEVQDLVLSSSPNVKKTGKVTWADVMKTFDNIWYSQNVFDPSSIEIAPDHADDAARHAIMLRSIASVKKGNSYIPLTPETNLTPTLLYKVSEEASKDAENIQNHVKSFDKLLSLENGKKKKGVNAALLMMMDTDLYNLVQKYNPTAFADGIVTRDEIDTAISTAKKVSETAGSIAGKGGVTVDQLLKDKQYSNISPFIMQQITGDPDTNVGGIQYIPTEELSTVKQKAVNVIKDNLSETNKVIEGYVENNKTLEWDKLDAPTRKQFEFALSLLPPEQRAAILRDGKIDVHEMKTLSQRVSNTDPNKLVDAVLSQQMAAVPGYSPKPLTINPTTEEMEKYDPGKIRTYQNVEGNIFSTLSSDKYAKRNDDDYIDGEDYKKINNLIEKSGLKNEFEPYFKDGKLQVRELKEMEEKLNNRILQMKVSTPTQSFIDKNAATNIDNSLPYLTQEAHPQAFKMIESNLKQLGLYEKHKSAFEDGVLTKKELEDINADLNKNYYNNLKIGYSDFSKVTITDNPKVYSSMENTLKQLGLYEKHKSAFEDGVLTKKELEDINKDIDKLKATIDETSAFLNVGDKVSQAENPQLYSAIENNLKQLNIYKNHKDAFEDGVLSEDELKHIREDIKNQYQKLDNLTHVDWTDIGTISRDENPEAYSKVEKSLKITGLYSTYKPALEDGVFSHDEQVGLKEKVDTATSEPTELISLDVTTPPQSIYSTRDYIGKVLSKGDTVVVDSKNPIYKQLYEKVSKNEDLFNLYGHYFDDKKLTYDEINSILSNKLLAPKPIIVSPPSYKPYDVISHAFTDPIESMDEAREISRNYDDARRHTFHTMTKYVGQPEDKPIDDKDKEVLMNKIKELKLENNPLYKEILSDGKITVGELYKIASDLDNRSNIINNFVKNHKHPASINRDIELSKNVASSGNQSSAVDYISHNILSPKVVRGFLPSSSPDKIYEHYKEAHTTKGEGTDLSDTEYYYNEAVTISQLNPFLYSAYTQSAIANGNSFEDKLVNLHQMQEYFQDPVNNSDKKPTLNQNIVNAYPSDLAKILPIMDANYEGYHRFSRAVSEIIQYKDIIEGE